MDDLPAAELTAWRQYLEYEPRGAYRADWQAAQVAKAIHDVALGFAGKPNTISLDQYLLKFQTLEPEDIQANNLRNARAIFGKVVPYVAKQKTTA